MENKKMMWVWVLIVVVVVAGLVYITINNKKEEQAPAGQEQLGQTEQNTNMDNVIQPEVKNGEEVKSVDGVKIIILKEGTGAVAKSGDTVAMNYTGKLTNGTTFDSNIDPKFNHVQPFVFTIDGGQVIKGWDVGVAGMKIGEKRKLELAPEFAYGERGQGSIPPNATLVFEVELLGIK